jgi:Fe-Mn family superoxide dismutase
MSIPAPARPSITADALSAQMTEGERPILIDVRRAPIFAETETMIDGAVWRDPAAVASWSARLPRATAVIVYCVHGHEVSQGVTAYLTNAGINARFLEGGIEGFVEAGGLTKRVSNLPTDEEITP